jgi:hypothetical protein
MPAWCGSERSADAGRQGEVYPLDMPSRRYPQGLRPQRPCRELSLWVGRREPTDAGALGAAAANLGWPGCPRDGSAGPREEALHRAASRLGMSFSSDLSKGVKRGGGQTCKGADARPGRGERVRIAAVHPPRFVAPLSPSTLLLPRVSQIHFTKRTKR